MIFAKLFIDVVFELFSMSLFQIFLGTLIVIVAFPFMLMLFHRFFYDDWRDDV